MTTRHDPPPTIGPARAHEPDLDCACGENFAPVAAPHECHTFAPPTCDFDPSKLQHVVEGPLRRRPAVTAHDRQLLAQVKTIHDARAAEARQQVRQLLADADPVEQKLAACRRIRRALDADREARVRGLITARPAWLAWSPLGDGRQFRRLALRQCGRGLALLGAATATVWLVFVAVWQAWP